MNKDTKNIFALISAAFSNRDAETRVRFRVLGRFGVIKIIFYLILQKKQTLAGGNIILGFGVPIRYFGLCTGRVR